MLASKARLHEGAEIENDLNRERKNSHDEVTTRRQQHYAIRQVSRARVKNCRLASLPLGPTIRSQTGN